MNIRSTLVSAIVVGGLMAGVGATPAMAAPRPVASSVPIAWVEMGASGGRTTSPSPTGSVATAPLSRGATVPSGAEARVLPVILAAAFAAAVRAVPGLVAILRPFVVKGFVKFFAAVRAKAPAAIASMVTTVASSILFEHIKRAVGW